MLFTTPNLFAKEYSFSNFGNSTIVFGGSTTDSVLEVEIVSVLGGDIVSVLEVEIVSVLGGDIVSRSRNSFCFRRRNNF